MPRVSTLPPPLAGRAATGANAYMFEYDNNLDFLAARNSPPAPSPRAPSCQPGMGVGTWYWHVKSRDAAGNWGSWSAYRTLEILPPAVKNGGFEAGGTNWYGYSAGWVSGFSHKWIEFRCHSRSIKLLRRCLAGAIQCNHDLRFEVFTLLVPYRIRRLVWLRSSRCLYQQHFS